MSADRRVHGPARRTAALLAIAVTAGAVAASLGGCLWEPRIEDQWTRVDIQSTNVTPLQGVPSGSSLTVSGRATVTYRAILTGAVVAELRSSSTLSSAGSMIRSDAEREPMAAAIDQILANSVSIGRDVKLVTGWDHLIQPFDYSVTGTVPAGGGLFFVVYMASATRIELPGGGDSIAVVPFASAQYQVLPVGIPLVVTP